MKKTKTVKIQIDDKTEKGFTVKELTVAEIIDLSQSNELFGATPKDKAKTQENDKALATEGDNFMSELTGIGESARKVMELSCDFKFEDVKALAPSDIKTIFDEWREVNATFLSFLERMGILEAANGILQRTMSDFSRTLAI